MSLRDRSPARGFPSVSFLPQINMDLVTKMLCAVPAGPQAGSLHLYLYKSVFTVANLIRRDEKADCVARKFCHLDRYGRTARDRFRRLAPLFCRYHLHRPLHGPERGEPKRLRARRAAHSMVGGACFTGGG